MGKNGQLPAETDREPRVQSAALPWRLSPAGKVEVLLVTSRETRRWVAPKGWPIKGLKSFQAAAREAFEEAGVEGEIGRKKLGVYHYDKRLRSGRLQHVRVQVFPLEVTDGQEVSAAAAAALAKRIGEHGLVVHDERRRSQFDVTRYHSPELSFLLRFLNASQLMLLNRGRGFSDHI